MSSNDTHLPDTSELAERTVELVRERTGGNAEAVARATGLRHGLTRFANSFIHQHVGEETTSVALTVALDGRVASATTSSIAAEGALADFVERTLEQARLAPVDELWPGIIAPTDVPELDHEDAATANAAPEERAELVRTFVDAGPDLRAAGFLDTEGVEVAIATSSGHRAAGRSTRATLDGIHQTATSAGSAHHTSRRLGDIDAAAAGALAVQRARTSEQANDLDPGHYEVVLAPEASATIALFLAFYGFNAKQHLEGQSFARLGEQQFDPAISIVDDVDDPRASGLAFDVEGTPKARTPLVEGGITRGLAHDRRTAQRADTSSTGHAVPGGVSMGPIPTNLVVGGGTRSREELIGDVERGLLVTTFNYCRILDPKTMVVTGLTRNGTFLIENGEVAGAVGNLRFTQSFQHALEPGNVLGVGSDDRWADSEFGPGMVIAPSLRLAEWNFTGGAKG